MNDTYLIYFALSFLVSFVSIPIIIYLSKALNIYDHTDERKIHVGKISRLGGVGIFFGFILPFVIIVIPQYQLNFNIYLYLVAIFISFIIGFLDDLKSICAKYKFLLQIITGIIVAFSGLNIDKVMITNEFVIEFGMFSYIITAFWVVMFMNAINLIDGMDGLASGVVFIANVFIFLIAISNNNLFVALTVLLLAGSILGFYCFNFPPAKIFMGDGGAYFLGFMYATLPLMSIQQSSGATLFIIPLILLLVPITDIFQVILRRMKKGYNIFLADNSHLHHRLLNMGLTTREILILIYTYTFLLGVSSLLMLYIQPKYMFLVFLSIIILISVSFYLLNFIEKIKDNDGKKII